MAALPARYECGWCGEQDRWPDRCDRSDEVCADLTDWRHDIGDHRRCDPKDCDAFVTVALAAERGAAAAVAAGTDYAVVCTECDGWEVRTFAGLQQAKPHRSGHGQRVHGFGLASAKGSIFVVRSDGGIV